MKAGYTKKLIQKLLSTVGITLNGDQTFDIRVYNEKFYSRVLQNPMLELGETYIEKWWDCEKLDDFFYRILRKDLFSVVKKDKCLWYYFLKNRLVNLLTSQQNLQTEARAFQVGKKHYDQGNPLYQAMLDSTLTYSCAYWKHCDNLEQAQQAKLELTCQKLQLKPGLQLLDIGCGWGSLCYHAAKYYGVSVLGVTVSQEQYQYAKKLCSQLPVEIRLVDYRTIQGSFDRICSIGMFEHVGPKNYHRYMQLTRDVLNQDGLFLLQTIGSNLSQQYPNPWIHKHIFPNGILPSIQQIGKATEQLFVIEDWQNFGSYYDLTLMAWYANFKKNWSFLQNQYPENFYRIWKYYLLACAGAFRARDIQLWQIVLSKKGMIGGYCRTT